MKNLLSNVMILGLSMNTFKRTWESVSVLIIVILSIPAVSESSNIIPHAAAQVAPVVPNPPTGLATPYVSSSQISISWFAPSNNGGAPITGYKIESSTDGGTTWNIIAPNVAPSPSWYSNYNLLGSTTYTFRVSAINSAGTSSPSNTASAPTYPPAASITLNPSSGPTGTSVTVTGSNFAANSGMTVTYDGAAIPTTSTSGGSIQLDNIWTTSGAVSSSPYQITLPVNIGTGSNRTLIVVVEANNNGASAITYNGGPMTKAISTFTGNDAEFWYQTNPASGSHSIVVTMTGSTSVIVGAYSLFGVDQTNPIPTTAGTSGTSNSPTLSLTTKNGNSWAIDSLAIWGGRTLSSPSQTLNWNIPGVAGATGSITGASSSTLKSTPGSVTFSWTATAADSWDQVAIEVKSATITATSTGGFTASITIPPAATAGSHTVSATDASSNSASAQFTVTTSTTTYISLNTNIGNVGTGVRVSGNNFAPNSGITISYDGTIFNQTGATDAASPYNIQTDSTGGFVGIIEVLRSASGAHVISAKDAAAHTSSKSITVMPHVFMYPSSGHAGSMILIPASQGNGFAANSAITIKFDGSTVIPSTAISSDAKGNFGGSFTVPSSASISPHQIQISDGTGNTYSSSYTVTDPSTPTYNTQTLVSGFNMADVLAFIPDNGPGVDGSGNLMIGEKNSGNIFVLKYTSGQFVKQSVPFVTIPNLQTSFEDNGVIGMAFDPNWVNTKLVYFDITRTVSGSVVDQVVRYHATTDSSGNIIADQTVGEQLVFTAPGFPSGHNGGCLKFDSAGNLYIAVSDHWTFTGAQDLTKLDGKILRITPLASPVNGKLYSIPATNPFASSSDSSIKKEIWGYGIRNVFTFDVDSKTSKVYASDVGYNSWERIDNFTAPGANAGWPYYEGPAFGNPQNLAGYKPQAYWYPHDGIEPQTGPTAGNEAIQGAVFYHGTYYPNLDGAYLFGDYGVDFISALLPSSTAPPQTDPATGVPMGQVVPIYYGLPAFSPINMAVWNQKLYILDMGNLNVLNYDTGTPPPPPGNCATCQLTVKAQDVAGNSLGQYTVLSNSSGIVATGFAPATFNLKSGAQYTVEIGDHKNFVFDHWADTGSTASSRPISITTATTITAVFQDTALVLNPTGGFSGTTVTVNGTTFSPNHAITLTYDGGALVTNPGTITSNSIGGFSATFQVPLGSIGPHLAQAKDGTNTHSALFTNRSN